MSSTRKTRDEKIIWFDLPPYIQMMDLAAAGLLLIGLAGMLVYMFLLNEVLQNAIPWILCLLAAVLTWHYRSRLYKLKDAEKSVVTSILREWLLIYGILFIIAVLIITLYPFSNPS